MIEETENRCEDEHTNWIERPLMADVTSADRSFSGSDNNREVEEQVDDERKDFGDNAEWIVGLVGHLMEDDFLAVFEDASLAVRIIDKAFDGGYADC